MGNNEINERYDYSVKELFLRHNVPAYISTSHLEEQNKLGFVLSVKAI